jgi:hypothetical protein
MDILEQKELVYKKNDPYSQVCEGTVGFSWYQENLCPEFFSKCPHKLVFLPGYHSTLRRGGDSWMDVKICENNTYDQEQGRYMHNHHAMLTQMSKWMSHLILIGENAKSTTGTMSTYVTNAAMKRINDTIEFGEIYLEKQEKIKRGIPTLQPFDKKQKKSLDAKKVSLWSQGNCIQQNRHFITYIIDMLAMFTTLDSTTLKATASNSTYIKGKPFKDTLQYNSKFWWWFFYRVVRGGFRGEQFLNSKIYPQLSKLGAFQPSPYTSLLRKRQKWLQKAKTGVIFTWRAQVQGFDGLDTSEMIWGHHFYLLSLVDPQLYVQERSKLKNYTHLPQISRKELAKELKSLEWSDKLPEKDLPREEDEVKRRELQKEFFTFCRNYLWSEHNNKEERKSDGYFRFFGAAWQDYFLLSSKSAVGRGGTYIRWRAENEQSTVSINEIDNLRKIMYPQPKKKAAKRSHASLEQSSDDESDDESDTEMTHMKLGF